jgi:Na+/H+-translocating membrane pyrophosphatase
VIADNVGDNVGDVAGMGADLLESYAASLIACAALAPALARRFLPGDCATPAAAAAAFNQLLAGGVALPFVALGSGTIASFLGIAAIRASRLTDAAALDSLLGVVTRGVALATILAAGGAAAGVFTLFPRDIALRLLGADALGLIGGLFVAKFTEYCTSYDAAPTRGIAGATEFGAAPVLVRGLGVGFASAAAPALAVAVTLLGANALAGA